MASRNLTEKATREARLASFGVRSYPMAGVELSGCDWSPISRNNPIQHTPTSRDTSP